MSPSKSPPKRILFQLSGSIAAFKACAVISKLVQAGHEVQVVATAGALRFVGAPTFEGLSGRPPLTDLYETGKAMQHIHAIRWADLAILCPASANSINKLATGIGDDLVSTLFLAHDFNKPYLIAPAMNASMYAHPATQASLARLQGWGVRVLESASGVLACGETGWGRLLEPDAIVAEIEAALSGQSAGPSLRILVTSGGTEEPIDSVRSISNLSTGRTGAAIASWLSARGHDVTLLRARSSAEPSRTLKQNKFTTFGDLHSCLRHELSTGSFDALVHAAAVGDYSVDKVETDDGRSSAPGAGKIDSAGGLTLKLKRNPKLLGLAREFTGGRPLTVVGFKLTSGANSEERRSAVAKLFKESQPDFVAQNDLSEIAQSGAAHAGMLVSRDGGQMTPFATKDELAAAIEAAILSRHNKEPRS